MPKFGYGNEFVFSKTCISGSLMLYLKSVSHNIAFSMHFPSNFNLNILYFSEDYISKEQIEKPPYVSIF